MPISSVVSFYPDVRKSMSTLKIPNLGIDLFNGGYWPKEYMERNRYTTNMQGISFNFEKTENSGRQDTVIRTITLKSNLYS